MGKTAEEQQELLDDIYQFISDYIAEHELSPSFREISAACFLSAGTTARYLDKLEFQERIIRIPGQARSIRLVKSVEN